MRGYAAIGLLRPKTDYNVGGAIRAAGCYGAAMIVIQGARYKHQRTDTMKVSRHIPVVHGDLRSLIPFDCVPVAVELRPEAIPLPDFAHPQRAFYIFGAEDQTLGREVIGWCRDVVQVPTVGCMNLAATVNVVLYDRLAKQLAIRTRVAA